MEIQTKLTDLFQLAYEEEQRFIASLSDDERSAIGTPEHWSVKDIIAHLAVWKARMATSLTTARSGDPVEHFDDIDQVNAEILSMNCVLQLHHPGTPVVYQTRPSLFEIEQETDAWGCIEGALAAAAWLAEEASAGMRHSPRGESVPPEPTFGPSGMQSRLN